MALDQETALRTEEQARMTWPKAQLLFAQAVQMAEERGIPLSTISVTYGGWGFLSRLHYWVYVPSRANSPSEGFSFHFQSLDEAKEYGVDGTVLLSDGRTGPSWMTEKGKAEEKAKQEQHEKEEWARLEKLTAPLPLHARSKAERKRAAKAAMQQREKSHV